MSRTWDKQQKGGAGKTGGAAGFASQPESKEQLQGQIAGLRQRAAVRKQKTGGAPATFASAQEAVIIRQQQQQQQQAEEQQQEDEPVTYFAAEAPSDSGDPMPQQAQQGPSRQRFFGRREHLSSQLTGMKKKAFLKQQMQGA